MLDIYVDGRLQLTAGATLLHRSRLLFWNSDTLKFSVVDRDTFEHSWRMDVDPVFGRLMCWMAFSSGAEFWVKGLCLLHGIEIREENKIVAAYPDGVDLDDWARNFNEKWDSVETMKVTKYGTLGSVISRKPEKLSKLDQLLKACKASNDDRQRIAAAYGLLQRSIRNRDTHAYIPNVRDSHYHLVPELFVRCFNTMTEWITPNGCHTLDAWMSDARRRVANGS